MAGTVIKVEGARELRASLRRLGVDVQDFKDIHTKVGGYVSGQAAGRAPRRTGTLASSGRAGAAATNATVRFGGARIPYANPVHWGTGARAGLRGPHNIAPHPFVVDAAHDTEPRWVLWYLEALNDMVGKVRGA